MSGTGKVQGGSIAGALTTIVFWLLSTYAHISPPPEIAAAITFVIVNAVAYFTPHDASVVNLIPKGSSNVTKALPLFLAATLALALSLSACAGNPATNPATNPLATALSRISNTAAADLQTAQKVALAATPPDQDGANCAAAALTVQAQVNKVVAAANAPGAGAFTVAELASLFQPGSAQFNQANNTLASGCVAKANDVVGPAGVVAAGGVAGVLAATNTILPLAPAVP